MRFSVRPILRMGNPPAVLIATLLLSSVLLPPACAGPIGVCWGRNSWQPIPPDAIVKLLEVKNSIREGLSEPSNFLKENEQNATRVNEKVLHTSSRSYETLYAIHFCSFLQFSPFFLYLSVSSASSLSSLTGQWHRSDQAIQCRQ